MNAVIHRFNLDLHSSQSQISIPVMQGDTNRAFHITLSEGGKPYHIEDGCIAVLTVKHPTGTHLVRECVILRNNTIEYDFRRDNDTNGYTAAVMGFNNCELTLYAPDTSHVASPKFGLVVHDRATPRTTDLPSADKITLDRIYEEEQTRQENEQVRIANEEARINAGEDAMKAVAEAKSYAEEAKVTVAGISSRLFSNTLRSNKSGSLITINDVSPLQDSLSVKVTSKNLIPFPYKSDVFHGETFDLFVNEDGTLTVGELYNPEIYDFILTCDITDPFTIEESGVYTLSNNYEIPSVLETYLVVEGTGKILRNGTYELTKGTSVRMFVEINGTALNGMSLKPQLEKGSAETTYTPPIRMGYKNVNLIAFNTITQVYGVAAGITYNTYNSAVAINNDGSTYNGSVALKFANLTGLAGKTVTLSWKCDSNGTRAGGTGISVLYYKGSTETSIATISSGTNFKTFTIPDDCTVPHFKFQIYLAESGVAGSAVYSDIQLELGTTATAYNPYVYSVNTVVSRGKNFLPSSFFTSGVYTEKGVTLTFRDDGSFLLDGAVEYGTTNFDKEPFSAKFTLPAGTYLFTSNKSGGFPTEPNPPWRYSIVGGGKIYYADTTPFTLTQPTECYTRLVLYQGATFDNVLVKPLLELNSTEVGTGFDPYRTPDEYAVKGDGTVDGIVIRQTNLLTTDADGSLIECNYNRDINKAYEELCKAIISLGGTV